MKSVLISIQPKWCELIANGEKTIEVRKTAPKSETPFKCYIYCTQDKYQHLYDLRKASNGEFILNVVQHNKTSLVAGGYLNGKVIGEFVCDEITTLNYDTEWGVEPPQEGYFLVEPYSENVLLDFNPCLTNKEMIDYGKKNLLYGWHISDLKIYDKPKAIDEFFTDNFEDKNYNGIYMRNYLNRPPQSWCYVEEIKNANMS